MKIHFSKAKFLAITLCAIALLGSAKADEHAWRPVEIEVYASIFKELDSRSLEGRELVVRELTSASSGIAIPGTKPFNTIRKRIPKAGNGVILDFLRVSAYPVRFPPGLADYGVKTPYTIMLDKTYLEIFVNEGGAANPWGQFHEVYPRSEGGFVTFSRVGYDMKTAQALVYAEYACGFLCGRGSLHLLVKKSGKWAQVAAATVWVS